MMAIAPAAYHSQRTPVVAYCPGALAVTALSQIADCLNQSFGCSFNCSLTSAAHAYTHSDLHYCEVVRYLEELHRRSRR